MATTNKLKSTSKLIVFGVLCFVTSCDCSNDSTSASEFGNRILNGKRAHDHQFPYQVSLQMRKIHHCGGSIISDVKVLTAGHCLTEDDGTLLQKSLFRILCGTNYLNDTDPKNYFSVMKYALHPKYDRPSIQYDYAVVFINGNFDFNSKTISTIPLATEDPLPGTVCYISGWGDIYTGSAQVIPNELQYGTVTVDLPEVCKETFKKDFAPKHMICAGRSNKENAGTGDSGGPLICNSKLNGIVSFGREYDDSKYPDVYSSVAYAVHWINTTNGASEHINQRSSCCCSLCYVTTFTVLFITQIVISTQF